MLIRPTPTAVFVPLFNLTGHVPGRALPCYTVLRAALAGQGRAPQALGQKMPFEIPTTLLLDSGVLCSHVVCESGLIFKPNECSPQQAAGYPNPRTQKP